jgi:hypothetical protein
MKLVDFRFRLLAFRGAGGEPPGAGVSPVPLVPLESRTLHSNQLVNGVHHKDSPKAQFFLKSLLKNILECIDS